MAGSLIAGRLRWPERPRYAFLGILLGGWTMYPAVMPNGGIWHPLGYILVLGGPTLIGYILW